jgi:hypothetical protein
LISIRVNCDNLARQNTCAWGMHAWFDPNSQDTSSEPERNGGGSRRKA